MSNATKPTKIAIAATAPMAIPAMTPPLNKELDTGLGMGVRVGTGVNEVELLLPTGVVF